MGGFLQSAGPAPSVFAPCFLYTAVIVNKTVNPGYFFALRRRYIDRRGRRVYI